MFQGGIIPSSYSTLMHSIDGVDDSDLSSSFPTRVVQQLGSEVFLHIILPRRRVWEYQIVPYECSNNLTDSNELSKYMKT